MDLDIVNPIGFDALEKSKESHESHEHNEMEKTESVCGGINQPFVRKKDLKTKLLEHYNATEPHPFKQFDCFCNVEPGDFLLVPDDDGDCIFRSDTYELMTGSVEVRVLIVPGTTTKDAVRALGKISGWIERLGDDRLSNMVPPEDYEGAL
jgi:hypothetical protein